MDAIRNIALAFAVRAQLFGASAFEPQLRALWRESVSVGCFAQEIARTKRRNVETAYLCGLLHRVGLAVILWRLGRASLDAGVQVEDESMESSVGGFEGQVGAQLARAWNLPEPVAARDPLVPHAGQGPAFEARGRAGRAGAGTGRPPRRRRHCRSRRSSCRPGLLDELGFYPVELGRLLERRDDIRASVETFL